jgi:hypothetical protein
MLRFPPCTGSETVRIVQMPSPFSFLFLTGMVVFFSARFSASVQLVFYSPRRGRRVRPGQVCELLFAVISKLLDEVRATGARRA